jgi:hypothetical protein
MKVHKKILIFLAILLLVTSSLLLLSQLGDKDTDGKDVEANSNPADDTGEVKIIAFNWLGGWNPVVGVTAAKEFNITISNFCAKNLNGLSLTLRMSDANGTELRSETGFYGPGVIGNGAEFGPFDGILRAKETRTVQGGISTDWQTLDNACAIGNITTVVQISLNGTVLDKLIISAV